jgi:uncharacterized damage-inducible protein DinB
MTIASAPSSMITPAYCTTLARYSGWINTRLYDACAKLPDTERKRDRAAFFGSIHRTLNHLLWGDRIWLGRLVEKPFAGAAFGADLIAAFDELRLERERADAALLDWSAHVTQDALDRPLRYTSSVDGRTRQLSAAVATVHLFNHGTHHRGQVTTLLSQAGVDIGPTDLPWVPGVVELLD